MPTFSLSCTISQPETELISVKLEAHEELLFLLWLPKSSLKSVLSPVKDPGAFWKYGMHFLSLDASFWLWLDQIILCLYMPYFTYNKSVLPTSPDYSQDYYVVPL